MSCRLVSEPVPRRIRRWNAWLPIKRVCGIILVRRDLFLRDQTKQLLRNAHMTGFSEGVPVRKQ